MKRPQYVFRPNLNDPQHRRAWALLQQVPPAKRKEFLVQSILAAEQTDRLEKSIRKVVREELQAVNIATLYQVPSSKYYPEVFMQKSLRCKDSRLGFGIPILFGIRLVILNFGITKRSVSREHAEDSEIRAALSSLNWPAWLKPGSLRICCLKMYPACYLMTEGGHLRRSLTRWTDWGMAWNGNVLTAKISASPSQETACTLSDILMSDVEEKYFLSPKQQEALLFKSTAATKESASTPPKD